MSTSTYEQKKQRLAYVLRAERPAAVRLGKSTSNLFRDRKAPVGTRLDVRDFNRVLRVDPQEGYIEVEGMTAYAEAVSSALVHGVMPAVVPELKSITVGGAVSGVGIESSSFRYGLVHETVQEMDVLLGDGRVLTCTPDNEHRDLFYGLPNSYGSLGYVLRLKVKALPVKPYVQLHHIRHHEPASFFDDLARQCEGGNDFVDGTIFGPAELYISVGRFIDEAPYTSDYTYELIYYQSIRRREEDYLSVHDYIWRWDTDWFWCSKNLLAQNSLVRVLVGRKRLNSLTYTKIMRWNSKWKLTAAWNRLRRLQTESVIQDVEVPIERAGEFLAFYHDTIKFMPVWVCPTRVSDPSVRFALYPMAPDKLYVNFGFWDVIRGRDELPPGHYNRLIEHKVIELGGMKSLYSDAYFTEQEFWQLYNRPAYEGLKARYDPEGRLNDLYGKCVRRE